MKKVVSQENLISLQSYRTFFESTSESSTNRNMIYKTISTPLFEKREKRSQLSTRSAGRIASPSPVTISSKIKNRNIHQDIQVTPELASQVIKQFLLPMFEADGRNIAAKSRSSLFGVNSKENSERTAKCKLSDIISKQLNMTNKELENLKNRWTDAELEKKRIQAEIDEVKGNLIGSICTLNNLKYQIQETNKSMKSEQLNASLVNQQINEYRQLNIKKEADRIENIDQLNKERIRNKMLGDKANELQHWNAALQMQNDIMGERLKGLYGACEDLCGSEKSTEKIDNEHQIIRKRCDDLFGFWVKTEEDALQTTKSCIEFIFQNDTTSTKRLGYRDEVRRLKNTMKEILGAMGKKVSQAKDERDTYEEKCSQMEKKFKEINESYAKVRLQIKEMNAKRKQFGLNEEKLCKNCNRPFFEKDNYNWSCLRHAGKWNGMMYWCCGNIKEDTPGCVTSKHESRDEDEEEENEPTEEIEKKKYNKRCPSCREIGHLPSQCPKDPNARSNVSQTEELDRIVLAKRRRDRMGNMSNEVTSKLKSMNKLNQLGEIKTMRSNFGFEDIEEVRMAAVTSPPINVFEIAKRKSERSTTIKHRRLTRTNISLSKELAGIIDSNNELTPKGYELNSSRRSNLKLSPIDTKNPETTCETEKGY
ncbi:unnamed protein product [Blepharisma stoltei]|uniref:CCHC-type domain-containing protein n=1 Tax=Blepharisma stoltei TaxID=1481888 RepID=A0AAU9J331_9CILI|nr:unnamed protein product [Blepharisma stoltei]